MKIRELFALAVTSLLLAVPSRIQAQYNVLYNFTGTNGSVPRGQLVLSGTKLYGMTFTGGSHSDGTVFQINTDGSACSDLHVFSGGSGDGAQPCGSLTLVGNTLYGMTTDGGSSYGGGTIFKVNTDGTGYSILHSFTGVGGDGDYPQGSLTLSGTTLYGMTSGDGIPGTIFRINTDGSGYTNLYTLSVGGGCSLALNGSVLYGFAGSFSGSGELFTINTNGMGYSIVYTFPYGYNGAVDTPIVSGSTVYGLLAPLGGYDTLPGIAFSMNTNGTGFAVLHSFGLTAGDGAVYYCSPTLSGNTLYGMTLGGGNNGYGTVYQINTNGTNYQILYSFNGPPSDGEGGYSTPTLFGLTMFGTTEYGGSKGDGIIFLLTLPSPPTITTTSPLPTGTVGMAYSTTIMATGGAAPYSWSITTGGLPDGLSLSNTTGIISGTPTTYCTSNFSVQVTDSNSLTATQDFGLTINPTAWQAWQLQYFGCTSCPQAAPDADPLGKGMSNTNQFLAGLNPTNPASMFQITAMEPTGSDFIVSWQTAGVRTNVVQATNGDGSGNYSNNFQDLSGPIIISVPGDTTTNYTDVGGATNQPARFYRVRLGP